METLKSILLIAFIVGIIGAVNAIITQSQTHSLTSPIGQITRLLGISYKVPAEPGRALNYVPSLIKSQDQPSGTQTQPQTPANYQQQVAPPSPTPTTNQIQVSPDLPPLPPISPSGQSLGAQDEPKPVQPTPTPSTSKNPSAVAGTKDASAYDIVVQFLQDTKNSFGF